MARPVRTARLRAQPCPPVGARLEQDSPLLGELGGTWAEVRADDTASGLIRAARQAGACQLVIGSRRRSRWSRLLNGSTVADQVLRAAGDLPVQVVNVGRADNPHRARDHRCRAERGVLRVPWPMACMAAGASLTLDVGWSARVILAGRDKRTRLRFSRISIARCADLVRSSASARGPLSGSVHPVREARATDQRPCAQDLRPGVGSTAEFLRREIGESDWQAWWCRLLTQRA